MALGDDARLSCETNVEWKKCIWKPPRNGVREVREKDEKIDLFMSIIIILHNLLVFYLKD